MNFQKPKIRNQEYLKTPDELSIYPLNLGPTFADVPNLEFLLTHYELSALVEKYNISEKPKTPRKRMSTGRHHSLSPIKKNKLQRCYVLAPKLNKKT